MEDGCPRLSTPQQTPTWIRTSTLQPLWEGLQPSFSLCSPEPVVGASDASAYDDGLAFIGGDLQPSQPRETPSLVVPLPGPGIGSPLGFQLQETQAEDSSFGNVWDLDPDTLPLSKKCPSSRAIVQLPLASDNQGNIYGLLYECTKKRPTAGFLREVMFQLTANTCTPLPTHVRRDFHPWADDLTHPSFNGFDGTLQLQVAPLLDDFKIFPWILQHRDAQGGCDGVCHSCPRSEAA